MDQFHNHNVKQIRQNMHCIFLLIKVQVQVNPIYGDRKTLRLGRREEVVSGIDGGHLGYLRGLLSHAGESYSAVFTL